MVDFNTEPLTDEQFRSLKPGDSVRWISSDGTSCDNHEIYTVVSTEPGGLYGYVRVNCKTGQQAFRQNRFAFVGTLAAPHTQSLAALFGVKL